MKDFFISYTSSDVKVATWIGELLETNGFSVVIQAWDFRPGDNFVSKINKGLIQCSKLIMVLSTSYLDSNWCESEWTAVFASQISSGTSLIIPIKVEPVELNGLLAPIAQIDIVDKTEAESALLILQGIDETVPRVSSGYPSYYNVEHLCIDNDYYVREDEIVFIKKVKFKVLIDNLNSLHNRVTWFRNEEVELISMTEGTRIEILDLKDTNRNYNVVFNRELSKNEEFEFQVKAILKNKHRQFENFLSTEIITTLKQLNVHLHLENCKPNEYYTQKICSSPFNVRTQEPQKHIFQPPIHWSISNPEINFEYKIWW